jgi:hypothetical protein
MQDLAIHQTKMALENRVATYENLFGPNGWITPPE